jgi:hypothetical protein
MMNSNLTPPNYQNIIGLSGKIGSGKDLVTTCIQLMTCSDDEIRTAFYENPEKAILFYGGGAAELASDFRNVKFAGKLKFIVAELLGVTVRKLEDKTYINTPLSEDWWYYLINGKKVAYNAPELTEENRETFANNLVKLTPRKLMQVVGTDAGREVIHPTIWVNATLNIYKGSDKWLISDVRFPNEAEPIILGGGNVIRIIRYKKLSEWLESYGIELEDFGDYDDLKISDIDFTNFVNTLEGESFDEVKEKLNHESETALEGYEFKYTLHNSGTIMELVMKLQDILLELGIIKEEVISEEIINQYRG